MMLPQININLENIPEKAFIRKTIRHIADRIILPKGAMSISFVDTNRIQELNRQYRGKDNQTDVLTFCFENESILSDVYICIDVVKANATEHHVSESEELARVIAHAFAHSVGYEHDTNKRYKIMHEFEDFLLGTGTK